MATKERRDAAIGQLPAELMWDDAIGTNLQMALFDAVGKELGVPVHRLLPGPKQRDWVPLSCEDHTTRSLPPSPPPPQTRNGTAHA